MERHPHHYYVTYTANSAYGQATGSMDTSLREPIRSMEDVQKIRRAIVENAPGSLSNVVVLGWQRFETED